MRARARAGAKRYAVARTVCPSRKHDVSLIGYLVIRYSLVLQASETSSQNVSGDQTVLNEIYIECSRTSGIEYMGGSGDLNERTLVTFRDRVSRFRTLGNSSRVIPDRLHRGVKILSYSFFSPSKIKPHTEDAGDKAIRLTSHNLLARPHVHCAENNARPMS